jgi:hypothetical protein
MDPFRLIARVVFDALVHLGSVAVGRSRRARPPLADEALTKRRDRWLASYGATRDWRRVGRRAIERDVGGVRTRIHGAIAGTECNLVIEVASLHLAAVRESEAHARLSALVPGIRVSRATAGTKGTAALRFWWPLPDEGEFEVVDAVLEDVLAMCREAERGAYR